MEEEKRRVVLVALGDGKMTKVVIKGRKANGEEFSKEVGVEETMLNLFGKQLAAVDLSPLA